MELIVIQNKRKFRFLPSENKEDKRSCIIEELKKTTTDIHVKRKMRNLEEISAVEESGANTYVVQPHILKWDCYLK